MKLKTLKKLSKYISNEDILFHDKVNDVSINLSDQEIDSLLRDELGYSVKKEKTRVKHLTKLVNDCARIAINAAKEKDAQK